MVTIAKKKIYISGPITGRADYEAKFEEATKIVNAYPALFAINPCYYDKLSDITAWTWEDYMRRDIKILMDCDGIALLEDWEKSAGARLEFEIAKELKMESYYFSNGTLIRN